MVTTDSTVDTLFDRLINALRRAWLGGPHLRDDVQLAIRLLKDLQPRAGATHEIAETLAATLADLERLPASEAQRRERIERIATLLKASKPHFGLTQAGPEIGKLNTALGERRSGRPAPAKSARQPAPLTPLPPSASITQLPRVGPKVAQKLEKLGIVTIEDALRFAPRRHIDYSRTTDIGSPFVITGDVTVQGEVVEIQQQFGTRPRVTARIFDGTGTLRLTWFNSFIAKQITEGDRIFASGSIQGGYNGLQMVSPEWEKADGQGLSTGRLIPVYPATQGVAQKTLRSLTRTALDATRHRLVDWLIEARPYLDDGVVATLPELEQAYEHLHYPDHLDQFTAARARFSFENLLLLQLGLVKRKRDRKSAPGQRFHVNGEVMHAFRQALPFTLTNAQNTALAEIVRDLQRDEPMTRLLQGDVGSGKTVVAATIALIARANGKQTAIMAPTELLAEQHQGSLGALYAVLPDQERPRIALLTGSTRTAARRESAARVESGEIDILIGTHALIQDTVAFHDLGLVVIDEQHRFGVRQRGQLTAKANGVAPHMLSMTATPIPRTLNLVLSG
ncbi:MAG: DEAD/DEAH box helicase, partial [Chloroflexota bacterium]|nr:DEAD/DEAH box helicase [Chloroflexota bacterium]